MAGINDSQKTEILNKKLLDVSNTFVQTLGQSIQQLVSNTIGYRIWSAPSVTNNCPDLKFNRPEPDVDVEFHTIPYNNSWDISNANNSGYDATAELQVYNGSFITKAFNSTNAYINYSSYLHNTYNYSTIPDDKIRFASFCWQIPESTVSYTSLFFTINSNGSQFKNYNASKIQVNNTDLLMFYAIRDTSTSTYNDQNINTVWINANKNDSKVNSSNYFLTDNTYGNLGGLLSITTPDTNSSSNSFTISVFVPAVKTSSSTYLYFRIGCPMTTSLSFNNVSSSIQ